MFLSTQLPDILTIAATISISLGVKKMKNILCLLVLFTTYHSFAAGGKSSQKPAINLEIELPVGMFVNSFYVQYENGGLDSCYSKAKVYKSFTTENNLFFGEIKKLKKTIRHQRCVKEIDAIIVAFSYFKEKEDMFHSYNPYFFSNPFGMKPYEPIHSLRIPVVSGVPHLQGKDIILDCSNQLVRTDYKTDCLISNSLTASLEGQNDIHIKNVLFYEFPEVLGSPIETYESIALNAKFEIFSNNQGAVGKLSPVKVTQLRSDGKVSIPAGTYHLNSISLDNSNGQSSRYIFFGGINKTFNTAKYYTFDLLASSRSSNRIPVEISGWNFKEISYNIDGSESDTKYFKMY